MQAQTQLYYSPEEYLALETDAEYKSEYHNGQIVPMAGKTPNQNQIAGNLYAALSFALKRKPYECL
jgi:Uma2 family endonuclease